MPEIEDILKDRGSRYGDFGVQSRTAQHIRDAFESSPNWSVLPDYMKEALSLMATKFSRMLTGDPMYMDNVVDLIGYMTLMKTEMEKWHASAEDTQVSAADHSKIKELSEKLTEYADRVSVDPYVFNAEFHPNPLNWRGPYYNR